MLNYLPVSQGKINIRPGQCMPAWLLVFHGTVFLETAELRQMGDTVYATFVACIGLEELSEGMQAVGLQNQKV